MFELRVEGTIFGEKGRIFEDEIVDNIIKDEDKKYFKKLKSPKISDLVEELSSIRTRPMRVSEVVWPEGSISISSNT